MRIKVLDYLDIRKEFFENKLNEAEKKLNYWMNANNQFRDSTYIHDKCSDAGMEMSFYKDVLEMLESEKRCNSDCEYFAARHQKCTCCVRNKNMKDCYRQK